VGFPGGQETKHGAEMVSQTAASRSAPFTRPFRARESEIRSDASRPLSCGLNCAA
jgi:hypothetical protein